MKLFRYSLVLLSLLAFSSYSLAQEAGQSIAPRKHIEDIVRDYILQNPEIIVEALQILEERRLRGEEESRKQLLSENRSLLENSEFQVVLGNPDGDVTLIEFFDYNCSFCKRTVSDIERLLENDKNIKIVLKEFPILGPSSEEAARVSIAAHKIAPEKYEELHKTMLRSQGQMDEERALAFAKRLGFDENQLQEAMKGDIMRNTVNEVYGIAQSLGLQGTPTFIIGDEVLPGAVGYDVLVEKIASMRQCGQTICS